MVKIIDCFIFHNEFNMLKFRLKELEGVADYHVLCESDYTFSGLKKELFFDCKKDLFPPNIIHLVNKQPDGYMNPWKRELTQRNFLKEGLKQLNLQPEDIILLSDVDEIPDVDLLKQIKEKGISKGIFSLNQDMYYYNLECRLERRWLWPKIFMYSTLFDGKEFNDIRTSKPNYLKGKGGWHLSYFGDVNYIINKIKSFSHQEFNNSKYLDVSTLEKLIKEKKDILQGGSGIVRFRYVPISENKYLPKNYQMLINLFCDK